MTIFIASSKLFSINIFISFSCTKDQWVFSKHGTSIIKDFLVSEGKNTGFSCFCFKRNGSNFCFCFKRNCYIFWYFRSLNSFTSVTKVVGSVYFPIDFDVRSFIKFDLKKEDQGIQKLIAYVYTLPKNDLLSHLNWGAQVLIKISSNV